MLLGSNFLQPQPAWSKLEDDECGSLQHIEETTLATPAQQHPDIKGKAWKTPPLASQPFQAVPCVCFSVQA